MKRLEGKTAVVTGGGTGIGLATAKRFVEEGAFVYIFGRRQDALDAALAQLGSNARAVRGSVSNLADLDRLFATVKAERAASTSCSRMPGPGRWSRSARSRPSITRRPSTPMSKARSSRCRRPCR